MSAANVRVAYTKAGAAKLRPIHTPQFGIIRWTRLPRAAVNRRHGRKVSHLVCRRSSFIARSRDKILHEPHKTERSDLVMRSLARCINRIARPGRAQEGQVRDKTNATPSDCLTE
ncbi:hypothetical protein CERZMDRAFT_90343 [Cercospora zeae-maydis SCOH1-5]|uniref:Uncharacterized protein n=1 Tax=Cercospora zeae-maydis SCOH1-5 TaxID=717836 RepID=A0A6A6FMA4_9PEZI|nr:hypothetical protein CERZMDRAFT_90343 [Cercospora zeae-maydis SCOH1-5]